ncbi:peptide N-acetyl-beta-D-glucosaminyl asparaginase amidase A-domain-containing protein [Aspergillus egyptiacus]|nr:peptide N-acetyl-beta-D-glucosaminyl asparaginase amidase A-domain-containing protein [Aspergillus egyptiacus]
MFSDTGAVPIPRHRIAQFLAFSETPTSSSSTPEVRPAWTITHEKWKLFLLLLIIGFVAWPSLCSRSRRNRSRKKHLSPDDARACDTTDLQLEKLGASSLSGQGKVERISSDWHVAKRYKVRPERVLKTAMLLILWSVVWLCSWMVSPSSTLLEVFQVYQPVPLKEYEYPLCNEDILLVDHVFGFSYGHPFLGYYEPPRCDFDTVRLNLTVTSKGRQFDRLAHMYLGDIEVFRTSTAEPTRDGIIWSYIKDLSQYNVLWKERQKIIFELGNLVNDLYTGSFNVTVTAHFSHKNNIKTADIVLPISAGNSERNLSSAFNFPSQEAKVFHKFTSTASRAVVSISACGQATEEFWWSNVFSSDTETFDSAAGELYGYSPFREIQLYVDGIIAGVIWPFPVIFTGGVAPGFWRPIVGTDAFDLRAPEIDISPFLPLLTDGAYHSFEIKIVGLDVSDDGTATLSNTVNSYWVVSGNIFLYLSDDADAKSLYTASTGQAPEVIAPVPTVSITRRLDQNPAGFNESLTYSVQAERSITISSADFAWNQNLSFSNFGLFNQQGLGQNTQQHTSGTASISRLGDDGTFNETSFGYPLFVNTTYGKVDGGITIDAWLRRGLEINSTGMPGISTYTLTSGPSHLRTEQRGRASYRSAAGNKNSTSFGDTTNNFESVAGGKLYRRSVHAVNVSIVSDTENFIVEL